MKKLLNILAIVIISNSLYSQLVTTPGAAASLVQNVLLGGGVTVSNISYSGPGGAIGQFTANGTNLGINSGIIITTGTIQNNGSGPHGPNNQSNAGFDAGGGGYGLLSNQIGGAPTYDAAILQFDFIPYSDTVRFKYVFGSEEYPEYVGTEFNDAFAFFISGPGISGIQNMAKLPSGQAVAINNVNGGNPGNGTSASNPAYFVYNGDGSNAPYNGSANYIQYDGFTTPLEAVSKVQCGKKYHLIIAIADVGDGIFDSGIFLEANSLQSKTPIKIDYQLSAQAYADPDQMAEGCVSTTVTLSRTNNLNTSITIPINVSGTATEGVDYSNIPNSITFNPGQTTQTFTFNAFADALTEGVETILLDFMMTDPCGNVTPYRIDLSIQDIFPVAVTTNNPTMFCPDDTVMLIANASGGAGPYTYVWNNGQTNDTIYVSPTSTQTYTVTVTDNCLNQSASANVTVVVPVLVPLALTPSGNITEICPYLPKVIDVTVTGGIGTYSYQWKSDVPQTLGTNASQNVKPSKTTLYTVIVEDQCGNVDSATVLYTITSPPLLVTTTPGDTICPGDSIQISVSSTGGYGQHFYLWPHSGETATTIWVKPTLTTNYTVIVSDECQTFTVEGNTTITVIKPIANFNVSSHTLFNDLPITFQNTTIGGVSYEWTFGDGNASTMVHPNNTYDIPGVYYITLIATDYLGCKDTITKPINILEEFYIYVPNTFTPDEFRFNNTFGVSTIGVKNFNVMIFNRWGEKLFESNDQYFRWDGTYDGKPVQDGTYTWKINYLANNGMTGTLTGHINKIK